MTFDPSFQTCLYLEGVTIQWIANQSVPYATTENQWVGSDNSDSIGAKVVFWFVKTVAQ